MAKNKWRYANTDSTEVGTMICTCCRKRIVDGWFRYRETKDAYLAQHKACCEDDKIWAIYHNSAEATRENAVNMLEDCIKFRDKWCISDLDELIEDLESKLNNA